MSIKPLDLQTLFIKMAQVGKEQASIQKSVENQQSREAGLLVKKEMDRDHSVNRAEKDQEAQRVKDKNSEESGTSSENEKHENKDTPDDEKPKYFTDPERGHNIDISG